MAKTLSQHRAAEHERLSQYLLPGAVRTVLAVIDQLIADGQVQRPLALAPQPPTRDLNDYPPTYFHMSADLLLTDVSPQLVELCEVERAEDLIGNGWERYLDPIELQRAWEQWMVAAQTKRGFIHLLRFTTPSGRQLMLREHVWPSKDPVTLEFAGWFGYVERVSKVLKMDDPKAVQPPKPPKQQSA